METDRVCRQEIQSGTQKLKIGTLARRACHLLFVSAPSPGKRESPLRVADCDNTQFTVVLLFLELGISSYVFPLNQVYSASGIPWPGENESRHL
jgi:hypothetical protein